MLEKDTVDREVYESAYERMQKSGLSSILGSPKLVEKRDVIKEKIISYYEGTEEFEKCAFIKNFFEDVEKELGISEVIFGIRNAKKIPKN